MRLNIPNIEGDNFLIAGAGGGFDVFGGLVLAYELFRRGKHVTLASYSVTSTGFIVRQSTKEDYPEGELDIQEIDVYTFGKNGSQLLKQGYEQIIDEKQIDCLILMDGGVDSLMHGDEAESGTLFEDTISLAAVSDIQINKYLVCLGFGSETEENLNHYRALENIAEIAKRGGFVGSCSLTSEMDCFKFYEHWCKTAWHEKRKSHIHTRIIPSVHGEFGNYQMYQEIESNVNLASDNETFVSPLSNILWFFDLSTVIGLNQYVDKIKPTSTFVDAKMVFRNNLIQPTRDKRTIPL